VRKTEYIWFGFGGTLETSRGGKYRLPQTHIKIIFCCQLVFSRRKCEGYVP